MTTTMTRALIATFVALLAATTSAAPREKTGRPQGVLATGKGLRLTPLGRMVVAHRRAAGAIVGVRKKIGDLGTEIARLETENQTKATAIGHLHNQVAARKGEIEENQRRTRNIGMIGALFGFPAVAAVSIVKIMDDDVRLRDLGQRIAALNSERAAVQAKIDAHTITKETLGTELEKLQVTEKAFDGQLAALTQRVGKVPTTLADAKLLLDSSRTLHGNLKGQVRVLKDMRASAADVKEALDGHIQHLERDLRHADKLVDASTRSVIDFVKIMIAKDPQAAAVNWLDRRVTSEASRAMRELGLDARAHVEALASRAIRDEGPAGQLLRKKFVDAVMNSLDNG